MRMLTLLLLLITTPAHAWRSGGALPPPDWAVRCWSDGVHTALHDLHWQDRTVEEFVWGLTCDLVQCTGSNSLRQPRYYPLNLCVPIAVTDCSNGEPAPLLGYPVRFVQPGYEGR